MPSFFVLLGLAFLLTPLSLTVSAQASSSSISEQAKADYDSMRYWFKRDADRSEEYGRSALLTYTRLRDTARMMKCLNAITSLDYRAGNVFQASITARKSHHLAQVYSGSSTRQKLTSSNNLSVILQENGHTLDAINSLLSSIQLAKQDTSISKHIIGVLHQNLGNNYSIIGDYVHANYHLNRSLRLIRSNELPSVLLSLASNAFRARDLDLSSSYIDQLKTDELAPHHHILYHRLRAKILIQQDRSQEAEQILSSQLQIIPDDNLVDQILHRLNLATALRIQENPYAAIDTLQNALKLLPQLKTEGLTTYRIDLLQAMSHCYKHMGKYSMADSILDIAIKTNTIEQNGQFEVLRSDVHWQLLVNKHHLIKSTSTVAEQKSLLEDALDHYYLSRNPLITYDSKLSFSSTSSELFDAYFSTLYSQYLEGVPKAFEEITQFVITTKNITFQENRKLYSEITEFKDQKLIQRFQKINSAIRSLKRKYTVENQTEIQDSLLALLDQRRVITDSISLFDKKKQKPIEFHGHFLLMYVDNKYYYLIQQGLTKKIHQVNRSTIDPLLDQLNQTWKSNSSEDEQHSLILLHQLSTALFPQSEIFNYRRLSVLTCDGLGNWPIEIFPKNHPSVGIRNMNFLGEQTIVEYIEPYTNDADGFQQKNILSIAPRFDGASPGCQGEKLSPLLCNQKEAHSGLDHFGGELINNASIDKQEIIQKISSFDIIHFATHVCIDTNQLYNHTIQLLSAPIYSSDLFNISWKNKSVVLTACSSGQGSMRKKEGIISFPRWLMELGSSEVLSTFWPIDDCQTTQLMERLFYYWKQTDDLPLALFEARKSYLAQAADHQLSPKIWGAFTVTRSMPAATTEHWLVSGRLWIGLLAIVMLLGILFMLNYK